jgi:hypothetical protein
LFYSFAKVGNLRDYSFSQKWREEHIRFYPTVSDYCLFDGQERGEQDQMPCSHGVPAPNYEAYILLPGQVNISVDIVE